MILATAAKSQDNAVRSDVTEAEELKPNYKTSLMLRDSYFIESSTFQQFVVLSA